MDKELDDKLVQRFPKLYRERYLPASVTCMCWGFPGNGWFKIIWQLSLALESVDPEIVAQQVKEKFGTLRFYTNKHDDETAEYIRLAERLSAITCEDCGKPGKLGGQGWYSVLCEDCRKSKR